MKLIFLILRIFCVAVLLAVTPGGLQACYAFTSVVSAPQACDRRATMRSQMPCARDIARQAHFDREYERQRLEAAMLYKVQQEQQALLNQINRSRSYSGVPAAVPALAKQVQPSPGMPVVSAPLSAPDIQLPISVTLPSALDDPHELVLEDFLLTYEQLDSAECAELLAMEQDDYDHELQELADVWSTELSTYQAFDLSDDQTGLSLVPSGAYRCAQYERVVRRWDAVRETQEHPTVVHHVATPLDQDMYEVFEHFSLDATLFQEVNGTSIQVVLHDEFIRIARNCTDNLSVHEGETYQQLTYATTLSCAVTGRQASEQKLIAQSVRIANTCWMLLDCASAVVEGMAEGGTAVVQRKINMVLHPLDTLVQTVSTAVTLLELVGTGCAKVGEAIGVLLACNTREEAGQELQAIYTDVRQVYYDARDCIAAMPPRDIIRHTTRLATELFLDTRLRGSLQPLLKATKHNLKALIPPRIGQPAFAFAGAPGGVAEAVEGVGSPLAQFMTPAQAERTKAGVDGMRQVLSQAKQVCHGTTTTGRNLSLAERMRLSACAGCAQQVVDGLPPALDCVKPMFSGLIKGLEPGDNFLRHIFYPDVRKFRGRLERGGGLHVCFKKYLDQFGCLKKLSEKVGNGRVVLESIVKDIFPGGYTYIRWRLRGITDWKESSLFASGWTVDDICRGILDVLSKSAKNLPESVRCKGNYEVAGFLSDGMRVKMIVRNHRIITAHPVFPGYT